MGLLVERVSVLLRLGVCSESFSLRIQDGYSALGIASHIYQEVCKVAKWEVVVHGEISPDQGWVREATKSCALNAISTDDLHGDSIKFNVSGVSSRVPSEVVIEPNRGEAKGGKYVNHP